MLDDDDGRARLPRFDVRTAVSLTAILITCGTLILQAGRIAERVDRTSLMVSALAIDVQTLRADVAASRESDKYDKAQRSRIEKRVDDLSDQFSAHQREDEMRWSPSAASKHGGR